MSTRRAKQSFPLNKSYKYYIEKGGEMKNYDDEILKILEATACFPTIRNLAFKK